MILLGRRKGTPAWSVTVWSYPCPDCDAVPGMNCRTVNGHVRREPHAARVAAIDRCPRCDQWRTAEAAEAGDLCDSCLALGHG